MRAVSALPTQIAASVARAFMGRTPLPILSVQLEKGEERLAAEVAKELLSGGHRGKIVTVHTEAQTEAAERRMRAELNSGTTE